MSIVQKIVRFEYQAKNNATGLSDVKAQVYFNSVAKAVGASALLLTQVDATNSPGLYELVIPAATLTSWGMAAGQSNTVSGFINSATAPAPAPFREELTIANADDLSTLVGTPAGASVSADIAAIQTKLGTPAGASVSADIASIATNVSAVKADLETGANSLATIYAGIQSLQNASIGNGVGFVLPTLLIPASGSNTYTIPITIQDSAGALINPTAGVTVGVKNAAGVDRGSYLTGSSGSPATVAATAVSTGQYTATVVVPSTEVEEELIFSFSYTVSGNSIVRFGVSQTLSDAASDGYALQSTLLATQTTVNTINTAIGNATYGLSALQALLTNGTYGLSIIAGLLNNATYGLSAINTNVAAVQSAVTTANGTLTNGTYGLSALQAQGAASQGTGFVGSTDSLHAISAFLTANLFSGGRAV